ncbi:ABC transporter substrate-binding protein [Streptomyces durbertensis]|uniref:ABC transporter substrate-binding protein n=1 Tax=Streptomyces durbertensis TaxID=2448886 RepID=UPI002B220C04|nr:ABC transporter substrate-binding protein [Streptomyces durbertensis]
MRGKVRGRVPWIVALCLVLVAAGFGGWRLLGGGGDDNQPIVVGSTSRPTALDPAGAYNAGSWALFANVYQGLLTFEPGSPDPVPDAAESCEFASAALTTYRCTLREGLRFSSGREVTADDVRHSIERTVRIKDPQGPAKLFDTLKSISTEGRTVSFLLKTADATFPLKLAGSAGALVDSTAYPADGLRADDDRVVGSGPFLLAEYRSERLARLVPNPDYRGAQRRPASPVTVRYYPNGAALAQAWDRREIEVNDGQMPPEVLAGLNPSDKDLELTEQSGTDIRMVVFNTRKNSAVADAPVRRAIAAVIDRQQISRQVHHKTVEPLYSLIPQGMTGHGTPFFDRYQQPGRQQAQRLLDEAGVPTPVSFRLAYDLGGSTATLEAEAIKQQLEATGLFRVKTEGFEWTEFLKGFSEGAYDAYSVGWVPDFPDPDTYTGALVGTGNALHNKYSSTRVDQLIRQTQRSQDRGRVMTEFRRIHDLVARDVPVIPLWQKKDYVLSTPDIAGTQYLSDNSGIWRLWELERL